MFHYYNIMFKSRNISRVQIFTKRLKGINCNRTGDSRYYHLVSCNYENSNSCVSKLFQTTNINNVLRCRYMNNVLSESSDPEVSEPVHEHIIFNSIMEFEKKRRKVEKKNVTSFDLVPVSLKHLNLIENNLPEPEVCNGDNTSEVPINFPYSQRTVVHDVDEAQMNLYSSSNTANNKDENSVHADSFNEFRLMNLGKKWMNDYEKYTEEEDEKECYLGGWQLDYGTANPDKPVSKVPCGGCGAFLHCQDPGIPGYLPSEIFLECDDKDLMGITCQRCHFMKHYNTALSVNVDQTLYPKLLSKIKNENALVLLMVDLTDFPCSIWPGILDIIGHKKPLFIVGNKIDLLWGDSKSWIQSVAELLRLSFPYNANIKHVSLISAKTGFGIEELINKLNNIWQYKGNVYLVGCTNVGKSTLFNALLQSDYCKVKAVDLLQRATTSPWPGTTLNLLKFPILRPEGWRLYLRTLRLNNERNKKTYEDKIRKELLESTKMKNTQPPQLIGHVGRSFISKKSSAETNDDFSIPNQKQIKEAPIHGSGLDPNDPDIVKGKWLYDTPGVMHSDQILDLLTTEELMLTIPKRMIEPRTFLIKPKWTIFIAGLARLDFLENDDSIRLTVFSSSNLPVTVCPTEAADQVYSNLFGTKYMVVPQGSPARLNEWPQLQETEVISLMGLNYLVSCADIVLSSAGWISVTPRQKKICNFIPWTPFGRGVHVRVPSLLPNAVNLRGKLIRKTPKYAKSRPFR